MEPSPHTERHRELVCLLAEEALAGAEKQEAQRNLLACEACLADYNSYSDFWRTLTSPDYVARKAARLKENFPQRYKLYAQVMSELGESGS